jgi:hypothetical protein
MINRRARQAALQILLLVEEFSTEELAAALALVGGQEGEDLLAFLARAAQCARKPNAPHHKNGKPTLRGETRALQEIKGTDPLKYGVLRDFEMLVREGQVLQTLDDFRAFGKLLGKEYSPAKSRKESVGRLMAVLSQMDLDSIRAVIARVPTKTQEEGTIFRRLANQIMSGPQSSVSTGPVH